MEGVQSFAQEVPPLTIRVLLGGCWLVLWMRTLAHVVAGGWGVMEPLSSFSAIFTLRVFPAQGRSRGEGGRSPKVDNGEFQWRAFIVKCSQWQLNWGFYEVREEASCRATADFR